MYMLLKPAHIHPCTLHLCLPVTFIVHAHFWCGKYCIWLQISVSQNFRHFHHFHKGLVSDEIFIAVISCKQILQASELEAHGSSLLVV